MRAFAITERTSNWLKLALFSAMLPAAAPWVPKREMPLAAWAKSIEAVRPQEPIFVAPDGASDKRGALERGTRLPIFAVQRGRGCQGRWYMVGPLAWACEAGVRLSPEAPIAVEASPQGAGGRLAPARTSTGLPHQYHFVGKDGSFGYSDLLTAEDGVPEAQLLPGFGVAIVATGRKPSGESYGLSTENLWLPLRDLAPVRGVDFHGIDIQDGVLDVAWVNSEHALAFTKPVGGMRVKRQFQRLEQLDVLETKELNKKLWVRVAEDVWLSGADVRVPTLSKPPQEVRSGERWIDVDLKNQALSAYVGETPVFTTLISSGRGAEGSEQATPKGVHRLWVKLRSSNMDNLENEEAVENYAIQAVPWVMYFKRGYGLHGTFWHRRFGNVQSHGCVNLSPLDAERIFYWTSPHVPAGWSAVFPTEYEPGTIVQVR